MIYHIYFISSDKCQKNDFFGKNQWLHPCKWDDIRANNDDIRARIWAFMLLYAKYLQLERRYFSPFFFKKPLFTLYDKLSSYQLRISIFFQNLGWHPCKYDDIRARMMTSVQGFYLKKTIVYYMAVISVYMKNEEFTI